jgi:hypothetical protein
MTITTRDQLIDALANNASRIILDKASLASQVAGTYSSMWRATGTPGQGAIPAAAAICTKALTGAIGFNNQTAPAESLIAWLWAVCSNNAQTLEIHDRIAHMGGLNLTLLTAQTVGVDVQTLGVPAGRIGSAGFDNLQWWYELYTAGGATASNATFNVTFDDNSTANLGTLLPVGGSLAASRIFSIDALKSTAQQARKIRGVNSVTLSASTGTAGSAGVTVTRPRTVLPMPLANFSTVAEWADTGLPDVPNDACLFPIMLNSTTSTGTLRGGGKIIHG